MAVMRTYALFPACFKRGYDCACAMIGHSSCFYGILK